MLSGAPNNSTNNHVESLHSEPQPAFSIATPAVTNILPISESISDTSFMLSTVSYLQEETHSIPPPNQTLQGVAGSIEKQQVDTISGPTSAQSQQPTQQEEAKPTETQAIRIDSNKSSLDISKPAKKRSKTGKKSTKLDAKSKLEKSRQSARECRARKKLRYQYLEDLVCNREKAVVKLREELSMFCDLSKQIDVGAISESDRRLIVDQTKENNHDES